MLEYFDGLGYKCPRMTNPADFALDLISVDLHREENEAISREKVRSLIESWHSDSIPLARETSKIATPAELGSMVRKMNPFHVTFPIVLHRAAINLYRQPPLIMARIMQIFGIGIIEALFFAPLKYDYAAVQSRMGFIQEFTAVYFVGMLNNIAVYPAERDVFYREADDGAYGVEAFLLEYTLLEVPFEILASLMFACLTSYASNLKRTVEMFFIVAFNCFCIVNCGESIGIMFNTLFNHTGFAVNVTSVVLSVAMIMGGVISLSVPSFLQAFNHLSPIKWSIGNLAPYSMRGLKFHCTESELVGGRCPITNGEQVLDLYHLDKNAGLYLMALGVCTVIYRIVAYLLLKAKRTRWDLRGFFKRKA